MYLEIVKFHLVVCQGKVWELIQYYSDEKQDEMGVAGNMNGRDEKCARNVSPKARKEGTN